MRLLMKIIIIEWRKLKRSGIMYIIWGAPILIILMQYFNFRLRYHILIPSGESPWWTYIQEVGSFWGALVLPIIATIIAAIICGIEHSTKVWKYMVSLPIKRESFYIGKLLTTFILLMISSFILVCGLLISGFMLGFSESIPIQKIWRLFIYPLLGIVALTTIQIWISTRFDSSAIPIGIGVIGVVVSLFVAQSDVTFWFPWAYPFMTAPIGNLYEPYFYSGLSVFVGLLITFIGAWEFSKRDIS